MGGQWGVNLASVEWRNNEHIDPSHAVDNRHDIERHTTPGAAPTHTHHVHISLGITDLPVPHWEWRRC